MCQFVTFVCSEAGQYRRDTQANKKTRQAKVTMSAGINTVNRIGTGIEVFVESYWISAIAIAPKSLCVNQNPFLQRAS